ncbi:AMPKBI-domain-containing protein [Polyplosphaeria fusca]|uniref:AMPKBI-domain-containing protein n=1 Tax=Polyplosphaeria fusca TaxID=682080 RepID=A0A9P4QW37_9PLEO|nr:AMPKBI-domain-containing protein [Polyplosphaeria fusca]
MGNQASRSNPPSSASNAAAAQAQAPSPSPAAASSSHGPAPAHLHSSHANPRRRESIQALTFKAHAAPPSATFEQAAAHPTQRPPSRGRSQTLQPASSTSTTAQVTQQLRAHDTNNSYTNMGNEQSRPKEKHEKLAFTPPRTRPSTDKAAAALSSEKAAAPSPQTQPVDVPAAPKEESYARSRTEHTPSIDPADASQDFLAPPPQYTRPPRLPLPIEEEVHTPGSPIISAADLVAPLEIDPIEPNGALPRRSSVLSSTTVEEDDDLGEEYKLPQDQPTVPTLIEWEGPGERVFVTGTFAGWNRKFKLHRNGPSKKSNVLSAMVNIVPGTHHLKFLVDNDMRTSDKLPTAVDYTNILVNYLEVSLDDVPQTGTDAPTEPKESAPAPVQELRAPPGVYPPQTLPPTPELVPYTKPDPAPEPSKSKKPSRISSPKRYHQQIPRYILDLDAPEDSRRFARASAVIGNLPIPPTLPMFLSKSILNGTTPMKDDSSVLILPNHTVLNHLATSSIKDNILATSATTRYKQKFLTTIMYKPRSDDSDREH